MRRATHGVPTLLGLLSAGLGGLLLVSPALPDGGTSPVAVWSALFGGALLIRLGLSAALRFRAWKARAMIVVGAWLAVNACLMSGPGLMGGLGLMGGPGPMDASRLLRVDPVPLGRLSGATVLHKAIGLAAIALGAASLKVHAGAALPRWRRPEPC